MKLISKGARIKYSVGCMLLALLTLLPTPVPAQHKLQSWNTNQREKSQRLLSAAMTFLSKGFVDKAASLLLEATGADPTDAAPHAVLGIAYIRQGKFDAALDSLRKSYQIEHSAETLLSTGFAYYLQHDYDAAIASWTRALERNPKMLEAYGDIAFAYLRKGDFVSADKYFRALIKARPSSQLAYQGLAVLNYLSGNLSAARKAAEHAQSIQSYYPVLLLLAKLDYLQGDPKTGQKRIGEWQRAAGNKRALLRPMTALGYPGQHDFNWDPFLQDNFDNGRLLLARTSTKKKNTNTKVGAPSNRKSQDLLSKAKQASFASPTDFYILRELALIEMAAGDFDPSAEHFREVLKICPSCTVDWLHLARALSMLNQNSEASYAVREFQRLHQGEKIADPFLELAKGAPALIPEMSPQSESKKDRERGPNDSGF